MNRFALLLAPVLLPFILAAPVQAGTCDVTEYPASGTLTAERMNQRIRQTEACVNGRIGNANWAAGEPLAVTNLQNQYAIFSTSWTIGDEDGDATAGEAVATTGDMRQWRVPISSTVIGMTVALRCRADPTCAGISGSVAVTLQKATTTIKSFTGLVSTTPTVDFAINNAIVNTDVLNIDIVNGAPIVIFVDVTIYYKAQHQA